MLTCLRCEFQVRCDWGEEGKLGLDFGFAAKIFGPLWDSVVRIQFYRIVRSAACMQFVLKEMENFFDIY